MSTNVERFQDHHGYIKAIDRRNLRVTVGTKSFRLHHLLMKNIVGRFHVGDYVKVGYDGTLAKSFVKWDASLDYREDYTDYGTGNGTYNLDGQSRQASRDTGIR